MNLTTEAWVPAVLRDGRPVTLSLCEAFERGHEIQDLAVRPHERIALMRLLICVTQAALDGPADHDEWKSCKPRITPAVVDYLSRWRHAFDFLGSGQRFLQATNLKMPMNGSAADDEVGGKENSKLDLALATANNTTLFDNAGGSERSFPPGNLALMLLTFQCFSPSGRIGVALWNDAPTLGWTSYPKVKSGKSNHAPCVADGMLHALLRGDRLLDSVHRNLMTKWLADRFFGKNAWGRPVWETMPQSPIDALAVANANRTYLGRLVPLTRAIWLADDRRSLMLANGLEYAHYPGWREPSSTIITAKRNGQPERVVLGASVERAAWRVLHALTVKAAGQNTNGGPAALQNVSDEEAFDLWVGGLVADRGKPVDTIESVLHVPAAMLSEPSQAAYEKGVRHAENTEFQVMRAVSVYHRKLGDNLDRPEMKSRRQRIQNHAAAQFWTDVDSAVPRLLEVAANPGSLGLNADWHKTAWGRSVWQAALTAYERACPHETPRQIRAYALGLRALATAPGERPDDETEKEDDA